MGSERIAARQVVAAGMKLHRYSVTEEVIIGHWLEIGQVAVVK